MSEFDRFAPKYRQILDSCLPLNPDAGEHFAGRKADYLRDLFGSGFAGRILDFGCGVGLLSRHLCRAFPQAHLDGFDLSAESLAAVPDELRRSGTYTREFALLHDCYDL